MHTWRNGNTNCMSERKSKWDVRCWQMKIWVLKHSYICNTRLATLLFPFQLLWTNLMTALDVWVFLLFLPASSANGLALLLYSAQCGTNTHNYTHTCTLCIKKNIQTKTSANVTFVHSFTLDTTLPSVFPWLRPVSALCFLLHRSAL